MIHAEYDLMIRACFRGNLCESEGCVNRSEFSFMVRNDHGKIIFRKLDLCPTHVKDWVNRVMLEGLPGL